MSVKLSVCIPVYNVEQFLERCAHSLFSQTIKDGIEFIFVNDCSPDSSIELLNNVLAEYPDRIPQVKIINHNQNQGVAKARQTGIDNASGEYITHCDGDDWVEPDMYATLLQKAVDSEADVVGCDFIIEETNRNKEIKFDYPDKNAFLSDVIGNRWGTIWKYIVKRTVLEKERIGFIPKINCGEDYIYTSKVLLNAEKYVHVKKNLYHYNCCNQSSLMHRVEISSAKQQKRASDMVFSLLDERGLIQEFSEEILIRKIFTRLQYLVAGGNWKEIYPEINSQLYYAKRISWYKKILLVGINYCPSILSNNIVKYIYKRK